MLFVHNIKMRNKLKISTINALLNTTIFLFIKKNNSTHFIQIYRESLSN